MKKRINNGVFYVVISLVACLGVGSFVYAYNVSNSQNIETYNYYEAEGQPENVDLGGASPYKTNRQFLTAGYQSGGDRIATSSTEATFTLTSKFFKGNITYIDWNAGLNTTLTTMATSSMGFMGIPNAGDERSYWFRSATTTAATTITLAAGTGVDIQYGDATGDDLVIDGLDLAKLTFIRKADSDVLLLMTKYTEGD